MSRYGCVVLVVLLTGCAQQQSASTGPSDGPAKGAPGVAANTAPQAGGTQVGGTQGGTATSPASKPTTQQEKLVGTWAWGGTPMSEVTEFTKDGKFKAWEKRAGGKAIVTSTKTGPREV